MVKREKHSRFREIVRDVIPITERHFGWPSEYWSTRDFLGGQQPSPNDPNRFEMPTRAATMLATWGAMPDTPPIDTRVIGLPYPILAELAAMLDRKPS